MIQADFFVNASGDLTGFRLTGHSGSAEQGSDIVCAAVSSAAYMTANTVSDVLRVQAHITADEGYMSVRQAHITADEGYMSVRVAERDVRACRDLLEGFKLHLLGLEEQYPQNIQVSYLEV